MIVTYVGMVLGLALGWLMLGPLGGGVGALAGAVIGMLWFGAADARRRIPAGTQVVLEPQRLLCEPKGQVATATFVRDARTSRWLDVERCTLCEPEDQVGCNKRCLVLIRDALPPRKHPVQAPTAQA